MKLLGTSGELLGCLHFVANQFKHHIDTEDAAIDDQLIIFVFFIY